MYNLFRPEGTILLSQYNRYYTIVFSMYNLLSPDCAILLSQYNLYY